MQGGGQFSNPNGGLQYDHAWRRAHEEIDAAGAARTARRHRRHQHGHFGRLHLGHRRQAAGR